MCFDTAGGDFDPNKGGHLILHELRCYIKMPPGRIVLFPSAAITHETVPISPGESLWSLTGYSAAGLWRYADQGMKTRSAWLAKDPKAVAAHDCKGQERWTKGCAMFKTVSELEDIWLAGRGKKDGRA